MNIYVIIIIKLDKSLNINEIFITKIIKNKIKAIIVIIKPLIKFFFYNFTLSITK